MEEVQYTVKALIAIAKTSENDENRTVIIAAAKLIADQAGTILDLLHVIKPFAAFESSGWYLDTFHDNKNSKHPVVQTRNGPNITRGHFKDALKIYTKVS